MKKKLILIIAIIAVLLVLLVPYSKTEHGFDNEIVVYKSLTYKFVKWGEYRPGIYFFRDRNRSVTALWQREMEKRGYEITTVDAKPVIYLYPEEETDVKVSLDYKGELTCTYPKYENGWEVTALPDGTLKDKNGLEYNYLYWEGESGAQYDFSKGFCVKGEDTAKFLEDALSKFGLSRREANEFIVYWLPLMQENPYNIISFQNEVYEETAKLEITPKPDTIIRVFMAYKKSDTFVEIEEQKLTAPNREGFTVVEWGGTIN